MNNEQDMLLRQKIEKREKIDTILAYVLMIILLGCIVLVLVLKFTRKEEEEIIPEEYVPSYISLSEISDSLNELILDDETNNEQVTITSNVSGNSLDINYVSGESNFDFNIPMVGNELMFTMDEENMSVVTDIYKEVASIICVYYGNEDRYCRNALDNIDDNGNDSIRIVNTDNSSNVYIDVTKSYTVNSKIVYNSVTKVDMNETDYVLQMFDVSVNSINVITSDTNIMFSGNVDRLNDDMSDVSVLVKLYDVNSNVIGENKYEYNESNVLEDISTFEIEFLLADTLKLEDINTYSIEIIK